MTVVLSIEPAALAVEPGAEVTSVATVRNTSQIVERYTILVLGAPSAWALVDPAAISLLPGAERTVTLRFKPPRGPLPNAATVPFAVKVVPTKQSDDTAAEEGEITIKPFVELVPLLRPRASRGATAGHHVLRLTNRGNTPVSASITASDPDELLKTRVRPADVWVPPGGTVASRVDVRPRQVSFLGQPQPRPFQVRVQPADAPVLLVDGSLVQRPMFPRWLPRAALVVAAIGVGTALYARSASHVTNVAKLASATTVVPTTVVKPPPASIAAASASAAPGGGAGGAAGGGAGGGATTTMAPTGTEPGLNPGQLSCQSYTPSKVNTSAQAPAPTTTLAPGASTTVAAGVTTTTSGPVFTVATDNQSVSFQFSQQADAAEAQTILQQYSQVCLIGQGEGLVNEVMVLEPFKAGAPTVQGTEKCVRYNNTDLQVVPDQSGIGWWIEDASSTPPTIRHFSSQPDANIGLAVAHAHSSHCWVGGQSTFSSLDDGGKPLLEYWR